NGWLTQPVGPPFRSCGWRSPSTRACWADSPHPSAAVARTTSMRALFRRVLTTQASVRGASLVIATNLAADQLQHVGVVRQARPRARRAGRLAPRPLAERVARCVRDFRPEIYVTVKNPNI